MGRLQFKLVLSIISWFVIKWNIKMLFSVRNINSISITKDSLSYILLIWISSFGIRLAEIVVRLTQGLCLKLCYWFTMGFMIIKRHMELNVKCGWYCKFTLTVSSMFTSYFLIKLAYWIISVKIINEMPRANQHALTILFIWQK